MKSMKEHVGNFSQNGSYSTKIPASKLKQCRNNTKTMDCRNVNGNIGRVEKGR